MYIQNFIDYQTGKWIVQKTTYNLLSEKKLSIKLKCKLLRNFKRKEPSSVISDTQFLLIHWQESRSHYSIKAMIKPKNRLMNISKIFILNTQYEILIHKTYYFDLDGALIIEFKNSMFSISEKFWIINKNLKLNINILRYKHNIIAIAFESRIRL